VPVTVANWSPRPRNRLWPTSAVFYNDLALVVLSSSAMLNVNLIGSLPGCDIAALIMLPFLLLRHSERAFQREHLWFYLLLGLWLFGTVAGDLYLGSTMPSSMKGIARVVFLGSDFTALAILINGKTRGIVVFTLGFVPVMLKIAFAFREDFLVAWKFGLAYALTLMALLVSCYFYVRRRHWVYVSISLGIAALNLIFASRSQIAIDLISLTLVLPILKRNNSLQGRTGKTVETFRIALLLTLACGAAYVANQAIKFGVSHGFFDETIQDKFQTQEDGRLGVLVGGRPETLVAIQAIRDSPLIGHGSFAVDPKYNWLQQDLEYENGYTESDAPPDEESAGIPAHSHLTQSWVESGIFGGIFWLYALFIASRGILLLISRGSRMAPLYAFLLVGFIWDILYSPMGSFQRLWGGFAMLITYNLVKIAHMEDGLGRKPTITNRWGIQPRRSVIRLRYIGRPYSDQGERRIR
jgi:O-antigen ligase